MITKANLSRPNSNIAVICLCGLAVVSYSLLARAFPVVYWYDTHIRLALHDQIFLGHWLPIIQILIVLISKLTNSLLRLRMVLAVIAGGTLFCAYVFTRHFFSSQVAFIAVVFLATNLMFVALAIVPYPEVLFIGLLFIAFTLLDGSSLEDYFYLGILALNLACLTRYEGWLLAVIFVGEAMWKSLKTKTWRHFLRVTLLSAFAPLGWLIFGISGSGNLLERLKAIIAFEIMTDTKNLSSHFLGHLNVDYLKAFAENYYHLIRWQAGLGIILLGLFGWSKALLLAEHRIIHWRILVFVVLDWLLLCLWQPWDFTNLRTAFVGEVFLILYAAYGLEQLIHSILYGLINVLPKANVLGWQNWVIASLVIIFVGSSVPHAIDFVEQTSQENDFSRPAQIGAWLKPHLKMDDKIIVLTDDIFQPYALATYTGLPYENVIDDRFDNLQIHSRLVSKQFVYVVELYRAEASLSAREIKLLNQLEHGTIHAQLFRVGINRVWLISTNELDI